MAHLMDDSFKLCPSLVELTRGLERSVRGLKERQQGILAIQCMSDHASEAAYFLQCSHIGLERLMEPFRRISERGSELFEGDLPLQSPPRLLFRLHFDFSSFVSGVLQQPCSQEVKLRVIVAV